MKPRRRTPQSMIGRLTRALNSLTAAAHPEDVIRARAEALLAYLAHVPVAILVANNRGRYVDANRHAAALTGYTRAQLTSKDLWELTPNLNQATARRLWRAFLRRGRMAGRYALKRRDGSVQHVAYLAIANVLPGVHVSALVPRRSARRAASQGRRKSRR